MARQLLGSEEVVLMEDGAIVKKPKVGGKLAWHQDYAYWPIATPGAVTCWIALDDVGAENGGMMVAQGSHKLGEKLPVEFGDGSSFMHDERPGIGEVQTPEEAGLEVVGYQLKAGECGFHHALIWHASGPNTSPNPRRGFIPRYVAGGTMWLGALRFPYNYTGRGARVRARESRSTARTSRASSRRSEIDRGCLAARRSPARDAPPVVRVGRDLDALLLRVAKEPAQPADARARPRRA